MTKRKGWGGGPPMASPCNRLKLPVNSDNIRHLVSNGGWGELPYMSIYIHTYEYVAFVRLYM